MPPPLRGPLPGSASFWANVRDGQDVSGNPLRTGFTCELISDWHDKDGRILEKGMAGKLLGFNDVSASIGMPGFTDGFTVPRDILKGGPVRYGTWTTKGINMKLGVTPSNIKDLDLDQQLPRAVKAFMLELKDSNFPFVGAYLATIGAAGEKIDDLTRRFVSGVRDAGLLDTLNMPSFTIHDIERNARLRIGNNAASRRSGVYLRIYTHTGGQVHEIETYVGKSKQFSQRYKSVVSPTAEKKDPRHWSRHHSDDITAEWVAVCILDGVPNTILFLVEQIFVSLLETYRADIITPSSIESEIDWLKGFQGSAQYMYAAARAAQRASNWPGATLSRPQEYGATKAMNLSSPIVEQGNDRAQLIRQDGSFELPGSNKLVRIANFRRAIPKTTTYNRQPETTDQSVIEWFTISWYNTEKGKTDYWRIASLCDDETVTKGIDLPPRHTVYGTVFEVRLDGKSHPMSYFRGPQVPVFLNSNIADSWALRIEWKDPTGQHRARYIQPMDTHSNWNYPGAARGASERYLRCISLIHHLFDVPVPDLETAYIDMGAARVIQGHRNVFLQEISYGPQTSYPNSIDYSRVTASRQIQMMKDGGLQKVNVLFANRGVGPKRQAPAKCDSCILETDYAVNQHASCEEKNGVNTNVCKRCYEVFGRAACSFTPHQRWRNHEDKRYRDRYRPLLHMPDRIEHAAITVDPELQLVPELDEEEGEVSDGEIEAFL
jgi:hypothetical protein